MAKKRKFVAYRNLERPYTRYSKFRKKSYIRTKPNSRVVRFDMGNSQRKFEYQLELIAGASLQIRDLAIESARLTSNRLLEKKLTKTGFKLKILMHPHHILRENPLAAGAGADRMSTGMKHSFGKVIGIAAQVPEGKVMMRLWVDKEHLATGRMAMDRARKKLPCACKITVQKVSEIVKKGTQPAKKKAAKKKTVKKVAAKTESTAKASASA